MAEDNAPKKRLATKIIITIILVSVVLVLGVLLASAQVHIQQQTQTIKNLVLDLEQRQAQAQQDVLAHNQAVEQKLSQQELVLQHIQLQAKEKKPSSGMSIFLLNKAYALLDLAQTNAYWTEDTHTTVALLDQADQLFAQTHDPKLLPVRAAIAQERAHQLNAPSIDIVRIISELSADQALIHALTPIKNTATIKKKNGMNSVWEKLQGLVILRRHDATIPIAATFSDTKYMSAALTLDLENAKWAALHQQQQIFLLSLHDAIKILDRGFDQNTSAQLKKHLLALQQQKLIAKTPITQDFSRGDSQ